MDNVFGKYANFNVQYFGQHQHKPPCGEFHGFDNKQMNQRELT